MRKLITGLVGGALLATSAVGFAGEGVYLGPSVSHYFLDRDRFDGDSKDYTAAGLNLGYRQVDGPGGFEIGYDFGDDIEAVRADLFYYLKETNGWTPYFLLGYSNWDLDEAIGSDEDNTDQIGAGFGVAKAFDNQWEVRFDGRFLEKISDGEDATDLMLKLGLNYYFNAPEPEAAPVVERQPEPTPPPTRTITVELKVLFEFDKAVVREMYGDEIQAVANAMREHDDIELLLEGHTDSIGTDAYNQDLSKRRVEAVKAKLVQDYGINPARIDTVGYGESRPIADNSTDAGRQQNRRVVGNVTFEEVVTE